jgi:hypothetical protein
VGLAWHSNERFPGLAYCLGGRSLYWGGWSPQFLDSEMPTQDSPNPWPLPPVDDLKGRFVQEANEQLGAIEANDFINGKLHEVMREKLLGALDDGAVPSAFDLDQLPLQIQKPSLDGLAPEERLAEERRRKLEAPYAVVTRARSGFFPPNKFSSVPLLMAAARDAYRSSNGVDNAKRLMVVPQLSRHETRRRHRDHRDGGLRPSRKRHRDQPGIRLLRSDEDRRGVVVLASAAVESTRLAQISFQDLPFESYRLIGNNFMAHTRADVSFRIRRDSIPELKELDFLEVTALQVRGRHLFDDGSVGHYHLQVAASATPNEDSHAERELFQRCRTWKTTNGSQGARTISSFRSRSAGSPRWNRKAPVASSGSTRSPTSSACYAPSWASESNAPRGAPRRRSGRCPRHAPPGSPAGCGPAPASWPPRRRQRGGPGRHRGPGWRYPARPCAPGGPTTATADSRPPGCEIIGDLGDRLVGLPDDPHRPLAELRVVLPAHLWHGIAHRRCLHASGGCPTIPAEATAHPYPCSPLKCGGPECSQGLVTCSRPGPA